MMRRKIIPYNPALKFLATKLRKQSTLGEVLLWRHLHNKQIQGNDFHRQKPLLNYIVDFYCAELNMVIEIDGKYHAHNVQSFKDATRESELEKLGLHILHFTEHQVRFEMTEVLLCIDRYVSEIKERITHP